VLEKWEKARGIDDGKATSLPEPPSHLTYIDILEPKNRFLQERRQQH
jgi:hypothetical protein